MTLAQYARVAHERRRTIATLAALGALSFLAYGWSRPPSFASTAQLFVSSTSEAKTGDADSATRLEQRVATYAELARSREVLAAAVSQLQLPMTVDQLEPMVSASAVPNTVLLDVTVTDASPTRSRDIANAIATQLPNLVTRIERPAPDVVAPVQLQVTHPAEEPKSPVSPGRAADLLFGLLAGLGLGLVTALVRGAMDATVRTRAQAARAGAAPVLAEIVDDPDTPRKPLITSDAFGPRTEAVRQLRTSLRCLPDDQRVRSILVASAVSGEGRTTTACNLAIALAQSGENVVLVDADLRHPGVADLLGLTEQAGLTSVLNGELGIMQALQPWRIDLPLRVLAAGPPPPNPSELIGSPRMAALVTALADSGVTVVLDSPALLPVTDGVILSRVSDGVVLVTRAGSTSCDDLTRARETVQHAGGTVLGVLLNRTQRRSALSPRGLAAAQALATEGWQRRVAERTTPADTLAASVTNWHGSAETVPAESVSRPHEGSRAELARAQAPRAEAPRAEAPRADVAGAEIARPEVAPVPVAPAQPAYLEPVAAQNGHSANGYSQNGYAESGYSPNGSSQNGYSANGYSQSGHAQNGHSENGYAPNGYAANGHSQNGYGANGYAEPRDPGGYPAQQANGQPVPRQLTPDPLPSSTSRPPGVERRQGRRRLAPPPDTLPDTAIRGYAEPAGYGYDDRSQSYDPPPARTPDPAPQRGYDAPSQGYDAAPTYGYDEHANRGYTGLPAAPRLPDPPRVAAADTNPIGHPRPAAHPEPEPYQSLYGVVDHRAVPTYSEAEPVQAPRPPEAIDVRDHATGWSPPADTSVWAPPTVWDPLLRTTRLTAAPDSDRATTFETLRPTALPARRHRH